jgi:hypothetical protein
LQHKIRNLKIKHKIRNLKIKKKKFSDDIRKNRKIGLFAIFFDNDFGVVGW